MTPDALKGWLLDSDPSLRWQVERDLADEPDSVWKATRARVATEGHGAALLALQQPDGQWAGGAFFPADVTEDEPQPWTATTWSLNQLREWGVEPTALRPDTAGLLRANARWEYDDLPYWDGEVDACINAFTLANGGWLGTDVSPIVTWLGDHQLDEGGWNCEWVNGSTRASFHSTLNGLVGILDYEQRTGDLALQPARRQAEEYLLARGLLRRLSTGERHDGWVNHLSYPYRGWYSALRALDYFRAAAQVDGTGPDERLAEAIDDLRRARDDDGTWHQQVAKQGRVWFEVDSGQGEPSRWLTFHALRVLRWWDAWHDGSHEPDRRQL
ncbi:squalene cyclase [Propionibacteriaceae bacterium Y1923]|uniref:squalene cyclase n=1 Tax=Aestuariimicrobium sp. Y1814 TaxID=3418742 RepID=UPI003C28F539